MPFNSLLLSIFAANTRFRGDVTSMSNRFQVLSIIYINLCIYGIVVVYELSSWYTVEKHFFPLTIIMTGLVSLSLGSLRAEKYDLAATIVVIHMNFINFCAALGLNIPMAAISGILLHPAMGFFLGFSLMTRVLNMILCMVQITHHIIRVRDIFKITLTDEQSIQIHTFLVLSFLSMTFTCFTTFLQKSQEKKLWEMVHMSYEKSEKLTKEVVQAAEAKDRFVSSLSHEIRNPLNALKGSIDYLLSVIKGQSYLKVLEGAKMSSDVLINLVNNVLDVAKLRSEKMEVSYTDSMFGDTVKKVLTINAETLKVKKIVAEASIDGILSERMWIDPSRLMQILMNLVSNALKFTPGGGKIKIRASWCNEDCDKGKLLQPNDEGYSAKSFRRLEDDGKENLISFEGDESSRDNRANLTDFSYDEFDTLDSARRSRNFELLKISKAKEIEGKNNLNKISEPWSIRYFESWNSKSSEIDKTGYLKVEVSDTGCGIASENIPKLFEMFVQAHQSVNTMHGGTGLGLWICKQLCQKMGGDIKLYSQVNKGTTFVFYIPVNNERQDRPILMNQGQARENVNVMVVDDYAHNRDLHKLLLEREGAKVIMACNGREAVEKYKLYDEGHFDFIMMDVLMPEIDGFEAARMIRKWEVEKNRRKKVDICFVSGEYYNEEGVMSAFKRIDGGAVVTGIRCLKKPVDIEMIRRVVDEYKKK